MELLPLSEISFDKVARYEKTYTDEDGITFDKFIIGIDDGEYYHPYHGLNKFSLNKERIPDGYVRTTMNQEHVKEYYFNPKRTFLKHDNELAKQIQELNQDAKWYYTHDNGGRPFLVFITDCGERRVVRVYKQDTNKFYFNENSRNKNYYTYLVGEYCAKKVHVGTSPECAMTKFSGGIGSYFNGNSILLELDNDRFVYIGIQVYEFTTDDTITEYLSPVGNNDVSYPFAIGETNVYFMSNHRYVPRSVFDQYVAPGVKDAYAYYYGHEDNTPELSQFSTKMDNLKIIEKRQ